ncbi:hypothetical protein [Thermoflavimicrobium dichotomicum]|uniref:Protein kinase domain-containing protein n=1 Tax=Thermoflavimicrobium dichotomicum TaxID=46223 RepID=A0A1I3QS98_9BACL|nr:hypothetical protein [Thermoflavimicrobium dichotomicum]SFJ36765.1 hypothetical protein SAMN05421852_10874 [Thermoflavimicrobium dichotomicum]
MEAKGQNERIGNKYRVLRSFKFVNGILYYTESEEDGFTITRYIHAMDIRAFRNQVHEEQLYTRHKTVFCPLKEVFIEEGILYQVFEKIEGSLLAYQLMKSLPLRMADMIWVSHGITRNLLELYSEKQSALIHPQNIFVTPNREIYFLHGGPIHAFPRGYSIGKRDEESILKMINSSDAYTVGVMMYWMVTGTNPLMSGLQTPKITDYVPDCPPVLADMISRAISFDTNKRPSIEEINRVLGQMLSK